MYYLLVFNNRQDEPICVIYADDEKQAQRIIADNLDRDDGVVIKAFSEEMYKEILAGESEWSTK